MPEHTSATPAFLWDRKVAGYRGTVYQAWLDLVQGKVLGMNYASFRRQVAAYNPAIALAGGRLLADQRYLLPRTVGADRVYLSKTTTARDASASPAFPREPTPSKSRCRARNPSRHP